jgi:acyl-CoA synthetase (AMP-forming)/AMP-acid ligase II
MKEDKNFNVAHKLSLAAQRFPDKKALVFPKHRGNQLTYESITFAELETRVNQLTSVFSKLVLRKGDHVLVMVPMSMDLYLVLSALLKMGLIAVFIDPWVGRKQIEMCCELTQPRVFIGTAKAHLLRIFSSSIRRISVKIVTDRSSLFGALSLPKLIARASPESKTENVNSEDPALLTFTTGSTGLPKGAVRTHGFLLAQHEILTEYLGLTSDDVDLPALPIFVLNNLANGITSVIPDANPRKPAEVDPAVIVKQIREFKVTTSAGSPALFATLARYCLARSIKLDTMRALFTGGAPVRPEIVKGLKNVLPQGEVYVVYGSTEAEPISMISAQAILDETISLTQKGKGNCVGLPVKEIEVRIIKISEQPIAFNNWASLSQPTECIGEIIVTGAHVNKSYHKNPQAVRENKFIDDAGKVWHRTGDTGYFDTQGRLWLVGRVKYRVIRDGVEYHPLQIEPIIDDLNWVARSALIGLRDARLGQSLVLVIEPLKTHFFQRALLQNRWRKEILELCQSKHIPVDKIYFCSQIPTDPRHQAKIEYTKLRNRYAWQQALVLLIV